MVFVLGTDEAGYGPNLGPLCIGASAWQLPDGVATDCFYDRLAAVVCPAAELSSRLAIADSKALYKAGGSLELLERGVLTMLAALDRLPKRWRDLWPALDGEALPQIDGLLWHDGFDEPLPLHATGDELRSGARSWVAGCEAAAIRLVDLQAAVLFPAAYNQSVEASGNKAEVLSLTTLRLARRVLEGLPAGRAVVFCDKHGGRSRYAPLLQHVFADELVHVKLEDAELSVYLVRHMGRHVEFRFQPQGEQHLPTALASMTAKYLRELAMRPFNAFWRQHVPNLRPTAGYPTDAKRFAADIAPARRRLQIADHLLWRSR